MTPVRTILVAALPPAILLLSGATPAPARDITSLNSERHALLDSLTNPVFDRSLTREIDDHAEWQIDFGSFTFEDGHLYILAPVNGVVTGAYFKGDGRCTLVPPTAVERHQARRFYGDSLFSTRFTELYLRFPDTVDLGGLLQFGEPDASRKTPRTRLIQRLEETAYDDLGLDLGEVILQLWSSGSTGRRIAYAQMQSKRTPRHHFILDDEERENVSLYRRPGTDLTGPYVDHVISFDSRSTVPRTIPPPLSSDSLIRAYDSDVVIGNTGEMGIRTTVTIAATQDEFGAFALWAVPRMDLDSVLWGQQPLEHTFDDKLGRLAVFLPQRLAHGDTINVTFAYRSTRIMRQLPWGDYWINHSTSWLPRIPGVRGRAHFTTRFRHSKSFQLLSSGEMVEESEDGGDRLSLWRSIGPVAFVSFNFGSFDHHRLPHSDTLPQIDVYRGKNHTGDLFARDFKTKVVEDIAGALTFYREVFGPYPYDHLIVTEVPGGHGQGHPQLLHLAWKSFQSNKPGRIEQHRAHEVAHQWWGHIIGWDSYHDQWLSEGIAEYAGAWYVQSKHPNGDEFDEILENWHKNILERGEHIGWHEGHDQAPIWLGRRAASYDSPGTYYATNYSKAAAVLHMLRTMMHDYETGSDERFKALLRDFAAQFDGRTASTDDFARTVGRHLDEDADWFFDQWIYGVEIPRLRYEWDAILIADGRFIVRGRIDQSGTNRPFRFALPIRLDFADSDTTFIVDIREATTEFSTPPLFEKPRSVKFNPNRSILCFE